MTATEQKWAERVAGWRESGLTSEKFCEGREFSANGLRNWAYKLGKTKRRRRKTEVRIARVIPAPASDKMTVSAPERGDSSLAIEMGEARVVVRVGFDRATLAAVLDVLSANRGAR